MNADTPLPVVAALVAAAHEAIERALDEAGIRNDVLRGMCLEVGLERFAEHARGTLELLGRES
jgi:hypothetical protein